MIPDWPRMSEQRIIGWTPTQSHACDVALVEETFKRQQRGVDPRLAVRAATAFMIASGQLGQIIDLRFSMFASWVANALSSHAYCGARVPDAISRNLLGSWSAPEAYAQLRRFATTLLRFHKSHLLDALGFALIRDDQAPWQTLSRTAEGVAPNTSRNAAVK